MKYDETLAFALAHDARFHDDGYARQHGSSLYDYLRDYQTARSRAGKARIESKVVREIQHLEDFLPNRPKSALIYPWQEEG